MNFIMNQTDFFILYLNLANRKAINNFLVSSKGTLAAQTKIKKTNLLNHKKGGPIKTSFAKEAFLLLAFSGLRKTIAVAEWKSPFGVKRSKFSNNICQFSKGLDPVMSSIIKSNDTSNLTSTGSKERSELRQKLFTYSSYNLLPVQTLDFSGQNLFYPTYLNFSRPGAPKGKEQTNWDQSLKKLMTLVRFKKTLNPYITKNLFSPASAALKNLSSSNELRQKVESESSRGPWFALNFAHYARSKGQTTNCKTHYYGLPDSAITFKKQATKLISKKFITLFNQRLLSQSFKNNFLQHLKNCDSLIGFGTGLFMSREDHKINLTSWAPIFDFHELVSSYGITKAHSDSTYGDGNLAFAQKIGLSDFKEKLQTCLQQTSYGKRNQPLKKSYSRSTFLNQGYPSDMLTKASNNFQSKVYSPCRSLFGENRFAFPTQRQTVQLKNRTSNGFLGTTWFGKNICFFSLSGVKNKIVIDRSLTSKAKKTAGLQLMFNRVPLVRQAKRLENSLNKVKRNSFMAKTSLIKALFNTSKKENLLASATLMKFYTASWLLESIRADLSLRNANIKRVLNQTFLLTQQPIFDSTKKNSSFKATTILNTKTWPKQSLNQRDIVLNKQTPTNLKKLNKLPLTSMLQKAVTFDSTETLVNAFANKQSLNDSQNSKKATIMPYLIKGLRISFSGRLGGKKGMAKTLTKTIGVVPLSTLKEKVDFAKGVVQTKAGSLGVKIWICYN